VDKQDAIIIGAGHNGLVAATYLAKAGKKVLVLERRPTVGGVLAGEELFPGFKYPTCVDLCGSLSENISQELELSKHGLEILPLDPLLFAPVPQGDSLLIPREQAKIADEISVFSKKDALQFDKFCALVSKLTRFLSFLNTRQLPDNNSLGLGDVIDVLNAGWKFHQLGRKDMHEFLRILPMSIADFLNEWFETEVLKATIAGSGVTKTVYGPRAQGTALVFLLHQMGKANGAFRTAGFVRGGIQNVAESLARVAQKFGAQIKTNAEVSNIITLGGRATGVVLTNGDDIAADIVVSNADVKRTFLNLVDPTELDPEFRLKVKNIRSRGSAAKVNLALDALPKFKSAGRHAAQPIHGGIIHIGPTLDYLERAADDAKYSRFSNEPFVEITIPSVADPTLAPNGKHVMSVWMQHAPYRLKGGNWNDQRERLGDVVVNLIETYAPGFKQSILHRQVLTPADLEQTFALSEGHLDHAEIALDQIFFMRPVPGWARYRTPIEKLYICGAGTHPAGISGLSGYYAAKEILTGRG
jgi:phytoene dehydrogenase-like protein